MRTVRHCLSGLEWLDFIHRGAFFFLGRGMSHALTRGDGRLKAYDRVNPYIALHECPSPSYIGDLVHLRWEGLIHPGFVQGILDTGMWVLFWTFERLSS